MRVAMVDPSLFTLAYDAPLVAGLVRAGHEVVLHGRPLRPEEGVAGSLPLARTFYCIADGRLAGRLPPKLRLALKGVDHAWSMARLLRRLRRERPDVIHFQWVALPLLDGMLLGQFRRVAPLVLTVHDTNPFNGDPSASLQSRGYQAALARFDRLMVHTAQGKARLGAMGLPENRLAVVAHGSATGMAANAPDPMDGPVTFLLFGKIKPYKGADTLIRAFAAMPEAARLQARIRIVGKPYMDIAPLQAEAASLGVPLDIEAGFVADDAVHGLFAPGTVAMFPYREIEASGVLFQALGHGRPVIASRLGSFGELLTDGVHGHLVAPDDVPGFAAAMAHIVLDRGFAAACAAAAAQRAATLPDWDEAARQTAVVYSAVARARAGGSRVAETVPALV